MKRIKAFGIIKTRLSNNNRVLRSIAEDVIESVQTNFEKEGRPKKWKELAPKTVKQRHRLGYTPIHILRRTGRLARLYSQLGTNHVEVGTNAKYAVIHHFGGVITIYPHSEIFKRNRYKRNTKSGKKKGQFKKGFSNERQGLTFGTRKIIIPARPFMLLQKSDKESIKKKIATYLAKGNG